MCQWLLFKSLQTFRSKSLRLPLLINLVNSTFVFFCCRSWSFFCSTINNGNPGDFERNIWRLLKRSHCRKVTQFQFFFLKLRFFGQEEEKGVNSTTVKLAFLHPIHFDQIWGWRGWLKEWEYRRLRERLTNREGDTHGEIERRLTQSYRGKE